MHGFLIAVASLIEGSRFKGTQASVVVACTGLVALRHAESSQPGIEPMSPALSSGHREVQIRLILFDIFDGI